MKKLNVLLLCLLAACSVNAQKIHTIIFADTNDAKIGEGVQVNVNNFLEFTLDVASGLGMENAYEKAKVYYGNGCNNANLKSCISNFSCDSEDIVIFGYFGHGGRSKDDKSEFPQMCLGANNSSDFVPLEDVLDALKSKARFVFVTGDCCNNYAGISSKRGTLSAGGPTTLTSSNSAVMKKLFGMKGAVISSGCQKGEYSWINSITGGFFTNGFLEEFDNYLDENPSSPEWDKLFENVRKTVVEVSRERLKNQGGYVQTPIWRVDKTGAPKVDNRRPPIVNDGTIRSQLLKLVDKSVSEQTRKGRIPDVRSYFSSDCTIEIYGRGGETLLGVKGVDAYLRTISTSPYLNNFVIQKEDRDASGKITLLRIHEIYVKN